MNSVLHPATKDVSPTWAEACRAPQYYQSSFPLRSESHTVHHLRRPTEFVGRRSKLCRWRGPVSGSAIRRLRHPVPVIRFPHYQPPPPISTKDGITNQLIHSISATQYPRSTPQTTRRSSISQAITSRHMRPMWGQVLSNGEEIWVLAPRVVGANLACSVPVYLKGSFGM
jgi:hypothetical protein